LKDEDNVNLADSRTGEILAQFPIVTGDGTGIQFNNSGTWLTVGSSNYIGGDGAVHVIDVASRAEIAVYDFKGFPWGAIFSPDDTFMTLMGESESLGAQIVELWNLESGEKVGTIEGITGATRTLYNADQSLLITGAGTSSASLIDTQTGTVLLVLDGQGSGATAYWYSPDETFIATGAGDGTMWLWGVVE
jgi:WD40 repeat protein